MKKLLLLSIFAFFTLMSASVFGQNAGTPLNPSIGDIRTYSVASHGGSTYSWTLQTTADGSGTDLFAAAAIASATGTNSSSVTVTWLAPVVPTIYYLHLTETNSGGCTNRKVLAIQPVNNFKLDIVNVDASGVPLSGTLSTTYTTCAPAITNTIAWNGGTGPVTTTNATDFNYNYGTTTFYYKITATGINFSNTSWTPDITITQVAGALASVTIETKVGNAASYESPSTILAKGSNTPNISAGAGNNVILVKVIVNNNIGTPLTANENLTNNDFTFTLNSGKDQNNNPAISLGNITTTQTQLARPDSGLIQY